MPFTFSHPAAALPLAIIPKRWISATGLVIGSITPDFEYFFRLEQNSYYSHTLTGVFWFDMPLALLLVYLFNSLIRKEIIESLPLFLNRRFSKFRYSTRNLDCVKDLLVVIISLLIGIMSHLIWDRLTHKSVELINVEEHYTVFWEANSLVGAIIIAGIIWKMPQGEKIQKRNIFLYWIPVSLITAVFTYAVSLDISNIRDFGISAIVGFFIGLIITSLGWQLKNMGFFELLPGEKED